MEVLVMLLIVVLLGILFQLRKVTEELRGLPDQLLNQYLVRFESKIKDIEKEILKIKGNGKESKASKKSN